MVSARGFWQPHNPIHCHCVEGYCFELDGLQFAVRLVTLRLIVLAFAIVFDVGFQPALKLMYVDRAMEAVIITVEPLVVMVIVGVFENLLFKGGWHV